jgi:hypothetical protein
LDINALRVCRRPWRFVADAQRERERVFATRLKENERVRERQRLGLCARRGGYPCIIYKYRSDLELAVVPGIYLFDYRALADISAVCLETRLSRPAEIRNKLYSGCRNGSSVFISQDFW